MKTSGLVCSAVIAACLAPLGAAGQPRGASEPSPSTRTAHTERARARSTSSGAAAGRPHDPDDALDAFTHPAPPPATLTEPPSDPLLAFPPAPPPPPLQPSVRSEGLARLRPFTPPTPPPAAAAPSAPDVAAPQSTATTEDAPAQARDTPGSTPAEPSPFAEREGPMHANLGAVIAAGESLDKVAGDTNPLGLGLGIRGEYRPRVDLGWVIGGRLLYFLGTTATLPTGEIKAHSWLFAADAGHAFDLRPLWLEPLVALGLQMRELAGRPALTTRNGQGFIAGSRSGSQLGFYLAPGLRATLPLSALSDVLQNLYLGVDTQLGLVFADSVHSQVELLVHAGLRL